MTLSSLLSLSANTIEQGLFPLKVLLRDSLYYPSCGIDGEVIRYCNIHYNILQICSYVYVDYGIKENMLMNHLDEFLGYHLFATRALSKEDLGADHKLQIPEYINTEDYYMFQKEWEAFGTWAVYERDEEFGNNHGPRRFSLLYLGAEGVAAYSGLYLANDIIPKAMAIIQPGTAFGFNWTDFRDWDGPLARTVRMGKSMPQFFFNGGYANSAFDFHWPGYEQIDFINHYYHNLSDGAVSVWQGIIVSLKVYNGQRAENFGNTLHILDNPRTLPHDSAERVFVEYHGQRYEATIGSYKAGDTLRGAITIKELILQNNWQPGARLLAKFFIGNDGAHVYRIIER